MSAQINSMNTQTPSLVSLANRKHVVGAKQIRKALNAGSAKQVFLAKNADPALTEPLVALCQHLGVEFVWVKSMTDLGHACGIEVGAAAAAITDSL